MFIDSPGVQCGQWASRFKISSRTKGQFWWNLAQSILVKWDSDLFKRSDKPLCLRTIVIYNFPLHADQTCHNKSLSEGDAKSHSAFSDSFADYEFKRKVPVSIYIFTWTVEFNTRLIHASFIVVKIQKLLHRPVYNSNISFLRYHYVLR